jgi:hypothetical protein
MDPVLWSIYLDYPHTSKKVNLRATTAGFRENRGARSHVKASHLRTEMRSSDNQVLEMAGNGPRWDNK